MYQVWFDSNGAPNFARIGKCLQTNEDSLRWLSSVLLRRDVW
jgi:hypothetical protein